MITSVSAATASVTSTRYAYSFGVNHPSTDTLSGDFTCNVSQAYRAYARISDVSSNYTFSPTLVFLRTPTVNPNGIRTIASEIVFINGHADYKNILFGESLSTGVYYGEDYSSSTSGYFYVGIESTDLSGVDLMSLVGCNTADSSKNENLASNAYVQGATTVVGFTDSITSRSANGQTWLTRYNDELAAGATVSEAISRASAMIPDSNLGDYVTIYGSSSNRIASSASRALTNSSYSTSYNCNIPFEYGTSIVRAPASSVTELSLLYEYLKTQYPSFDENDYKITVNIYNSKECAGQIILRYFIDGLIETNKAFVAPIDQGIIKSIYLSEAMSNGISNTASSIQNANTTTLESSLIQRAQSFIPETVRIQTTSRTDTSFSETVKTEYRYFYNYLTDSLTYEETIYNRVIVPSENPENISVIVDAFNCWPI